MPPSIDKAEALKRIDTVLTYVEDILDGGARYKDEDLKEYYKIMKEENPFYNVSLYFNVLNKRQVAQVSTRLKQTLFDMSPRGSEYWNYASSFVSPYTTDSAAQLYGALQGLREDYVNDFLKSFNEMVDAELFTDILEQAEYLRSQGYVRASAVVAGVALESHLRKLAEKNSIPITKDDGEYVKAESLNGELRKKEVIDKTINKSITGWLGLRNDAAHPDTKEINEGLIEPMIAGIRVFIQHYPA